MTFVNDEILNELSTSPYCNFNMLRDCIYYMLMKDDSLNENDLFKTLKAIENIYDDETLFSLSFSEAFFFIEKTISDNKLNYTPYTLNKDALPIIHFFIFFPIFKNQISLPFFLMKEYAGELHHNVFD